MVYLSKNGNSETIRVHRLVAITFIDNPQNKSQVDHIYNDKQDNNVNNLRWSTGQENSFNRTISKNNSSGSKGVYFEQNRWRAQITHNKKRIHIGCYDYN